MSLSVALSECDVYRDDARTDREIRHAIECVREPAPSTLWLLLCVHLSVTRLSAAPVAFASKSRTTIRNAVDSLKSGQQHARVERPA
jgi:hypothetical protein